MSNDYVVVQIAGMGHDRGNAETSTSGIALTSDGREKGPDLSKFDDESAFPNHRKPTLIHNARNPIAEWSVSNEPFSDRSGGSQLSIPIRGYDPIVKQLNWTPKNAALELADFLNPTNTDILTTNGNYAYEVVHIGREAIRLGDYDSTLGSSGGYQNCERGIWGTLATQHQPGDLAYEYPVDWENRRVRIYHMSEDGILRRMEYGRVASDSESSLGTNDSGVRINLPVQGIMSGRDNWKIHQVPNQYRRADNPQQESHNLRFDPSADELLQGDIITDASKIRKRQPWAQDGGPFWFRLEDGIFRATKGGTAKVDGYKINGAELSLQEYGSEMPEPPEDTTGAPIRDPVHELFVIAKNIPNSDDSVTTDLTDTNSGQPEPARYPFHPLAIDAAVCLSKGTGNRTNQAGQDNPFDVFRSPWWGLGLRWAFEENIGSRVRTLVNETLQFQVDLLVMGWDASPVEWLRWSEKYLLNPFGFQRGKTDDGSLTYQRIALADVEDYSKALDNKIEPIRGPNNEPGLMKLDNGRGNTTDTARVTYRNAPTQEGQSAVVKAKEGGGQARPSNEEGVGLNFSVIQSEQRATTKAVSRLLMQHYAVPRLSVRVRDPDSGSGTSDDYSMGEWVTIGELPLDKQWLVDNNRNRIKKLNQDIRFSGQIVGRSWNPKDNTYRLELMLLNFRHGLVRKRAPSARILEIEASNNRLWIATVSEFGHTGSDAEEFHVNDEISIWNQFGTLHEQTYPQIDNIASGTAPSGTSAYKLELNSWFSTDPTNRQMVRLANFDNYANATILDNVDRVYAYIADNTASPLISGDAPADPYG